MMGAPFEVCVCEQLQTIDATFRYAFETISNKQRNVSIHRPNIGHVNFL